MPPRCTRRGFLAAGGASLAAALPRPAAPPVAWPLLRAAPPARPVAISSDNGVRAAERAGQLVLRGADTLDAAVEGVKLQELDPEDTSVGWGGLPNEEGVVQLDASCMHGPSRRAGAVAALEGIRTPSEVARLVLRYTDHILLVGDGAKRFALSYGFREEELLTPKSREAWLRWRANRSPTDHWTDIPGDAPIPGPYRTTGTINLNVINPAGDISSVTTTSGLAWKLPGRAGDSPIIGAGQYTDNDVGAAGSTGRGESNIMACGAFLTVEFMRQGMAPTDAALATLRRVIALTPPSLMGPDGRPRFSLQLYALNKRGEAGAASIFPARYALFDGREARLRDCAVLFA
ncbi:MAG: N(4)-(beta-N-acetylglucosaminyl)-L-asparaginase [Gemmatimonadales bacterium]|nr:N(4)-(beta-N-acetylglucosaminyl)-L-asparaginase [Gemmatimonadales bacterium]